jgi:hypothetical protein
MSDDEQPYDDEPRGYGDEDEEPRQNYDEPAEDDDEPRQGYDEPAPQEDEPQDYREEPEEEPQPEPEPEPEPEPQEEAKAEPPKHYKLPSQQKVQQQAPEDDGAALSVDELWKILSKDNPPFNWYVCSVVVEGKSPSLKPFKRGSGGLQEVRNVLTSNSTQILLGLLRVNSNDKGGSTRAKFVYIRFVGKNVPVMQKAKLTPQLGKFSESFPVKHLTLDLDDDLTGFSIEGVTKEFLRVGGAHKPDSYSYGPNQLYNVK